ncbi:MAG TPA: hypothetical protein VEL75_08075 [Candidatus Methylomirabilis sp.]|jgi:hypothetical protein|nr:hypothetical protein [Candidatus Methylomirabilis sp.]
MLAISRLVVGVLLLVLGRRLYWLFVASIGFVCGLELGPRLLPHESEIVVLLIALGLALVGALVAVVGTKVVLGVTGFVTGGGIAALLLHKATIDSEFLVGLIYLVAGAIGAVLFLLLFNTALIVLSSLAGASLVAMSAEQLLGISATAAAALGVVLVVLGIVIQASLGRPRRPSP